MAAGFAALLSTLTLGVTAGEAGLLVAARHGALVLARHRADAVEESRQLALTDALTGLGNRAALLDGPRRRYRGASGDDALSWSLFDLDGFKHYNDRFGHPAGDALLARLGARSATPSATAARAYRLGGDEFCVLLRAGRRGRRSSWPAAARRSTERRRRLRDRLLARRRRCCPHEARDTADALRLADQRMYAQQGRPARRRPSARPRDVLLACSTERAPDSATTPTGVAELAAAIGGRLGMSREELEEVVPRGRAARHRQGRHPGRDPRQARAARRRPSGSLMRQHTVVGERILAAAPALGRVAELVRSTHERFDGNGYPDGLAGEDDPARRADRRGLRRVRRDDARPVLPRRRSTAEQALAELRRCAGTQFDPAVVDAARAALEHPATRRRAPSQRPACPNLSPVARIQGLVDIIRLVRMRDEPDRLLDEIAGTVGIALGLGTVVINLYRPEWDDFVVCSVHGNAEAREMLLGSTYPRGWFGPIMDSKFLRRGAYVIEQGTFDWESHLGDRYVPSWPKIHPGAWQPEDELFVPFRHCGQILGIFSVGDPASGLRPWDEEARRPRGRSLTGGRARRGRPGGSQLGPLADRAHPAPLRLVAPHQSGWVGDVLSVVCSAIQSALGFDKVVIQLRDDATGNYPSVAGTGWSAGDAALETPTTAADLDRLLDPSSRSRAATCCRTKRAPRAARRPRSATAPS